MRIALIGPVPPRLGGASPGGVATHQVQLAAGLAAAGVTAPLLATNVKSLPTAWHALDARAQFPLYRMGRGWLRPEYLNAVGVSRLVRYAARLRFTQMEGSRREVLRNLLWYRHFIEVVRPDVIHVQHPLERCTYARLVERFEGWHIPLVVTAHSLFGEHAESVIEDTMAPNLRAADRVIAVSEHIADQAIGLGVESERVRVIRSGVDTERFAPRDRTAARQALKLDVDVPLVLFVGNLEPRKQVDVLLRAMVDVRREVLAKLVIVGSGDSAGVQDQTARLGRLTNDLGLAEAVTFVGRVNEQELLDSYAAADVFALPSTSEAQGLVALEAMACGLPVVASAVGGLVGTIEDGQTGYLVPPGDVVSLAERLGVLLRDAKLRQTVGDAARLVVERDFSWTRAVQATLAVYAEALE